MSKARTPFNWLTLGLLVAAGFLLLWSSRQAPQHQSEAHADQSLAERADTPLNEDKPFAAAHVIMQLNDPEPAHHTAALSIANNLIKHYGGSDQVDVEIISFGGGVSLLFAEQNGNRARIQSLMQNGIRFYICGNTLDTIAHKTGQRPQALPGVVEVPTGVASLVEEMARGYKPVHP